jgi:[NiFe] hydrogenase large subunit
VARSVIDPVTRIEGHLRVEMEVSGGVVKDAWVSGGLFRGLELILKGREPRDAYFVSQRICGVCPISHGHTSTLATEAALYKNGAKIPENARIIRNLLEGAQFLHSHILWFYNLAALDWVSPVNALKANIADTYALAEKAGTSIADFGAVQKRLKAFVENGQLSIFSGNWFDAPGYKLPPELDLICTAHYLEALTKQAEASQISAIIGGKMPHVMTTAAGGTTWMPSEEKLADVLYRFKDLNAWITNTMIPDTLAIAPYYLDAAGYGAGVGDFGAWGVFEEKDRTANTRALPAGMVIGGKLADVDETKILEYVKHSYYTSPSGLNPTKGVTTPEYSDYNVDDKYTWSKAPRYDGKPVEVGGLARLLVAYNRGVPRIKALIDSTLATLSKAAGTTLGTSALVSTLGRTAGRNLETLYVSELMLTYMDELIASIKGGDSSYYEPLNGTDGEGTGMWEAPRGALLHYTNVKGNKIENYQAIVPSTWNISPRDDNGVRGPMEQALIGCPVESIEKPVHALRTVHSFDPCVACAVHISEPKTGKSFKVVTSPIGR